jgi:membrane dipeptidase
VLDHLCHAAEIAGVEHVGLGSDYDGIGRTPQGLEDASCYGRIAAGLLARGFGHADVRAMLGGNMERAFAVATGPGTRAATEKLAPFATG